jgi:hypothetical protein
MWPLAATRVYSGMGRWTCLHCGDVVWRATEPEPCFVCDRPGVLVTAHHPAPGDSHSYVTRRELLDPPVDRLLP